MMVVFRVMLPPASQPFSSTATSVIPWFLRQVVGGREAVPARADDHDLVRRLRGRIAPEEVRMLAAQRRSTMPARSPVSSPFESVGTPFTSTCRMPAASRFGSKTVPRSANPCGSKTAMSARAPSRRTPRSERPIRSAGWPVSRWTASCGREQPLVADHEAPEPRRPGVRAVEERLGERARRRERGRVGARARRAGARTPRAAGPRRRRG